MKKVSLGFTTSGLSTRVSRRGYTYVEGEPPAALSETCLACPCCDSCCKWAADALRWPTIQVTDSQKLLAGLRGYSNFKLYQLLSHSYRAP